MDPSNYIIVAYRWYKESDAIEGSFPAMALPAKGDGVCIDGNCHEVLAVGWIDRDDAHGGVVWQPVLTLDPIPL